MPGVKEKVKGILSKKYAYGIMLLIDLVFAVSGWLFFSSSALFISALMGVVLLFLTDEFKYSLPFVSQFIFLFSGSYKNKADIILYACACALMAAGLLVYQLMHKMSLRKGRMTLSYLILAVLCSIPVFYNQVDEGYKIYILLYFQWWLYLGFYIYASNLIKGNMLKEMCKTYGMIGVLLAFQCIYGGLIRGQDWFFLGWGHANYANMLMILFSPLVFYMIWSEEKKKKVIYIAELLIMMMGCYATHSRAFYVFFLLEAGLIYLYLVIKNKKYRLLVISVIAVLCLAGLLFIVPVTRNKIISLMSGDSSSGFLSGRDDIWKTALDKFTESPLSVIFGHGAYTWLSGKYVADGVDVVQLCHCTFFQTLTMMGILGVVALGYHFFLKYRLFIKEKSLFGILLLIAFIVNDLYGLIDNTYHTFFFMFTFIIIYEVYQKSRENVNDKTEIQEKDEKEPLKEEQL